MIWWRWLRNAILIIFFELCIGRQMGMNMDTTGCCKRSIKLFFSVDDNSQSNSSRHKLYIFISFFFSPLFFLTLPFLFPWLFALISFNFHLHVLLLPSLFFFLSMLLWSIPFFYVEWMCLSLKLSNNKIPRLGLDRLVQT